MNKPTPEQIKRARTLGIAIVNGKNETQMLFSLYSRWQDEKEYEDINEYGKAFARVLARHGAKVERASKRPFGFVVSHPDMGPIRILIGARVKGNYVVAFCRDATKH